MPRVAWGQAIFADDLRVEVGGKISIIGIYQVDLIIPNNFPLTLAKLAIRVEYFEEKGALSDDLSLRIWAPGIDEPIFLAEIPRNDLAIPKYPYEVPENERDPHLYLMAPVIFSPLIIQHEGFIRVAMQCGKLTTALGRIMVRKARPEELGQFSSFIPNASGPPPSRSPSAS
jgi:hypothetical protein